MSMNENRAAYLLLGVILFLFVATEIIVGY